MYRFRLNIPVVIINTNIEVGIYRNNAANISSHKLIGKVLSEIIELKVINGFNSMTGWNT